MIANRRLYFWLVLALLFFVFLFLIRSILLPFVLGIFTAYLLDPSADRLEKWGLSRGLSTLVITIAFFFGVMLLSLLIVPILASQLSDLVAALPDYIAAFEQKYGDKFSRWLFGVSPEHMASIKTAVTDYSGVMVKLAGDFITSLFQSGMAFVTLLSLVLITPVVAFYLLRDWDTIVERIDALLPRAHAAIIREQVRIIDQTLAGFIRGQLTVCLVLGVYYALGLSLVGLKFGIIVGLATGLLVIVPYAGQLLGMAVGLGMAFFQFDDTQRLGLVLAVFLIGQVMEGYFITPKLVGEKVGLHPVWIIFGMLAGGALFGFVGVLLALPTTAIIGVLIRFALKHYLQSEYYKGALPVLPKN